MRESRFFNRHVREAAFCIALLFPAVAASAEDWSWDGRLAPGQAVEIKGINGEVKALSAAGDRVEVTAVKKARRSDPALVQIKAVEHAGGVTICAVYPTREGEAPNECRPGEGRMNVQDNDVDVSFTVRVPAGVRFVGRTVNGSIEADGLRGDVDAHTVNGGVRLSTAGRAEAETVNGSITAAVGQADGTEPLSFKTVNGSIALDLPAGASAEVRAATVNGEVRSDFPLGGQARVSRRRLSGTIGGGGRPLALDTVNGSIHIRQR
jgi:hypothetical protein